MPITPLNNHVIVERGLPDRYKGKLIMPAVKHDDKTTTGIVLSVGPKVYDVRPLDLISFPKYANKEFIINNRKILILTEDEIFAVIG